MKINIISSELKVIASSNIDISKDLSAEDSSKTLGEILNEKEEAEQKNTTSKD